MSERHELSARLYRVQQRNPFPEDGSGHFEAFLGYLDNAGEPDSFPYYGHLSEDELYAGAVNEAECEYANYEWASA